ncbi:hypothetical protein P3T76_016396 [Phytophthora citrophthora]|uniref:Uncharacterized protein n=1 Tax=Phytophthora citrophthora TaxID=4793 RepID=A0AAD9LA45_9STRA|nr:hypothetical protein P3T76_016396 [Phytophthora citrophthora]
MNGSEDETVREVAVKKKRVRFATDVTEVKVPDEVRETGVLGAVQQGSEAGIIPPPIEEKEVEALTLCVRLVDATYLEDVFLQAGRSDLTSCQPFITFAP